MIPDDLYAGTHRSQFDGSSFASQNCTPTSGANGARAATGGRMDRSGGQIRALVKVSEETNPSTPGWSLRDLELAMSRLGVPFERRQGTWAAVVAAHDAGLFVVLQGDSDQFANGTCSGVFDGDHAVGIHPGTYPDGTWPLADPICRQRRPEQPSVLRDYAAKFAAHVAGRPTSVISFGVFLTPVPVEADVNLTAVKVQRWTANGTDGALRPEPNRAAPVTKAPAGTVVYSYGEYLAPDGNNWRVTEWPQGTVRWFLRTGPGVPADHDWIAAEILTIPPPPPCTPDQLAAVRLAGARNEWDDINAAIPPRP